jgi:ABC-2 type transport system ATP-binding protein
MRETLRALAANGKTIIISSHILAEVQQICTRVAIIKRGTLVKEATIADLMMQNDHHEFLVQVDRPREAIALLRTQLWGRDTHMEPDGTIVTGAPEHKAANLARFLIQSNFVAEKIMPREQNLEHVFLDLTSD